MDIQEKAIDTILNEGVEFEVTVNNPTILHRLGIRRKSRKFKIYPATLGTLLRISKIIVGMKPVRNEELKEGGAFLDAAIEHAAVDGDKVIEIIALSVTNRQKKPSARLIQFLRENITAKELGQLLSIVIRQLDISDFYTSIILLRGMSLANPEGIIASGGLSEA